MDITADEVGWTIRKISRLQLEKAIAVMKKGNGSIAAIMKVTGVDERDAAGIISYLATTKGAMDINKQLRTWWSKQVQGKVKTGEVKIYNGDQYEEVRDQLKQGKAAQVGQIIQMLRGEVTSKEAQIGLDELGKYTSRPEVFNEAGDIETWKVVDKTIPMLDQTGAVESGSVREYMKTNEVGMKGLFQFAARQGYSKKAARKTIWHVLSTPSGRDELGVEKQRKWLLSFANWMVDALDQLDKTGEVFADPISVNDAEVALIAKYFGVSEQKIKEVAKQGRVQ